MYRRLTTPRSKQSFLNIFKAKTGFDIPLEYVIDDVVWAYEVKGSIVGGFAIVRNDVEDCRLIEQILDPVKKLMAYNYFDDITELTCYFIDDKKYSIRIKLGMALRCLLFPDSKFFYSYETYKESLAAYYALGNPTIFYRGPVARLAGMPSNPKSESVEYLTKYGIVRICVLSSIGQIIRGVKKLWQR